MLVLSNSLFPRPILSLRLGQPIADTIEPIVNPTNLRIEAFYCQDRVDASYPILLTQDIREIIKEGLVVNDHEVLTDREDLVRLKDLLDLDFQIVGKQVVTVDKEKVGKVADFAIETTSYYVQKLYVDQGVLRRLSSGQLSIDRSQIVEVTKKKIVIKELLKTNKLKDAVTSPAAATAA